jgi:hypothetical protein
MFNPVLVANYDFLLAVSPSFITSGFLMAPALSPDQESPRFFPCITVELRGPVNAAPGADAACG